MDNPPPNYNPNESVLAGGINSSTPITMLQGGGALEGYNESASVLEGGINSSTPITMVQGGGVENSIQIVLDYNVLDTKQYDAFIKKFSSTGGSNGFNNAASRLKLLLEKNPEKVLKYRKGVTYVESSNLRNTTNTIQVKYVPSSTKTLIILPPTNDPKLFINQIMFLVNNQYLLISSKGEFKLERNVFVISLFPFNTNNDPVLNYFYYKLKLSNIYSYYKVNDPFVFIVRKEVENKKGILIAESGFKFFQPLNPDDLAPIDYDLIIEENIESLKYKTDSTKTYDNLFYQISNGDDPESPIMTDYTFTLKTSIAVLDLIDEDIEQVTVDIHGEKYRIRLPLTPNKNLDKVYAAWKNKKYVKDETRLIDNLRLEEIDNFDIPQFLFSLSYFKCFDDTSILTSAECNTMKQQLQKVYVHSLKRYDESIEEMIKTSTDALNNRVYLSHECKSLDLSDDKSKIKCTVTYNQGMSKNLKTTVEIDAKHIPILKSGEAKDIETIKQAVLAEFSQEK
jgi:hypothetical protein